MNVGTLLKAGYSTTPSGERLTDTRNLIQGEHINWKTVEENVNKLQTRIAKAVRQSQTAARYRKGYRMLERSAVKVARSVLRRGRASNRSFLFDKLEK